MYSMQFPMDVLVSTELSTTPRIDNPENLAILDTQDTGRRQTKQKTQHIIQK